MDKLFASNVEDKEVLFKRNENTEFVREFADENTSKPVVNEDNYD